MVTPGWGGGHLSRALHGDLIVVLKARSIRCSAEGSAELDEPTPPDRRDVEAGSRRHGRQDDSSTPFMAADESSAAIEGLLVGFGG
jgi:hypothetical protein